MRCGGSCAGSARCRCSTASRRCHSTHGSELLEWLADEVLESGGEATIWVGELASAAQERELASRMANGVAAEYRALIADASAARSERSERRRRTLARLRRELRRIRARDYFPPPERELAQRAVEELAVLVEEPVG